MPSIEMDQVQLSGYYPGLIGQVIELHAVYYHQNWGLDLSFECQEARELSEFMTRYRQEQDLFLAALVKGVFAGSVGIDGSEAQNRGARLRWFIVAPRFQGRGIGGLLLGRAIEFCRRAGHGRVVLWTFAGLEEARRLYERAGFRLAEEYSVAQWGQRIKEQMFELHLAADSSGGR